MSTTSRSCSPTIPSGRGSRSRLTADWTSCASTSAPRGRRGNYSESELREWAGAAYGLRARVEVFAYFNNDWEGFAVRNALRLRALVEE